MRSILAGLAFCIATSPASANSPDATEPNFVADHPADARLARKAWAAATACTGWSADAHEAVELRRLPPVGGFDGRAYIDADGLHRVEISGRHPERSVLHEIAHAWARRGPSALNEGRTDLLADCIALRLTDPNLLDPDDGRDLVALPDLRRWTNPRTHEGSGLLDGDREDAYLGSARLMRVVAAVVPERSLWPEDGALRWRELEGLLVRAGPKGAIVWDVLQGGLERQRPALSDEDRDGQPWLAEILRGTDPARWDSDHDGWWDGAPPAPVGAVPLPPDGTAVCSGVAAGQDGARLQVRYRATRSARPARVRVRAGEVWIVDDPARGVRVDPGESVLLALDGGQKAAGGAWALAGGQSLTNAWNCRSNPRFTVWVDDPAATVSLDAFARHVDDHLHRAEGLLAGPAHARLVVALGSEHVAVREGVVHLSSGLIAWAKAEDRLDALAALAVALHRTWDGPHGVRRWDTAEALTRALVDDPPETLFVAVDEEHPAAREQDAARCAWSGVVEGRCAPAPERSETP